MKENSKSEARNSKQARMFKTRRTQTPQIVIANEVKVVATHVPRIKCGVLAMTILFG
jgi:hypothetical protein